jgi:rubredoxin-NAD+ reductase
MIISKDDASFYSKPLLSNALSKGKTPDELITTPTESMQEQLKATIFPETRVQSIDSEKKTIMSSKGVIEYETLVLATGAKPLTPPLSGDIKALQQVNHLIDYRHFRKTIEKKRSVLILGSGLVGCEFANDLVSAGLEVKLVSIENSPLIRQVPLEISEKLKEAFVKAGIQCYFSEMAIAVSQTAKGVTLTMKSGQQITADCALCAIGIAPDLTLAKTAGIKTKKGIVVNEFMQTSDPYIYALGDAIEFNGRIEPYIAPLLLCARALAKNLGDPKNAEPLKYPIMPITVKTPLYPIVFANPLPHAKGTWRCSTEGDSIISRFLASDGRLCGFAIGNVTGELRMALMKELTA